MTKKQDRNWQKDRVLVYVLPETREKIKNMGTMGNTYDTVINELINFVNSDRNIYMQYVDFIRKKNND